MKQLSYKYKYPSIHRFSSAYPWHGLGGMESIITIFIECLMSKCNSWTSVILSFSDYGSGEIPEKDMTRSSGIVSLLWPVLTIHGCLSQKWVFWMGLGFSLKAWKNKNSQLTMVYLLIISKGWNVDCPGKDQVHFPCLFLSSPWQTGKVFHQSVSQSLVPLSGHSWTRLQNSSTPPLENQLIFNLEWALDPFLRSMHSDLVVVETGHLQIWMLIVCSRALPVWILIYICVRHLNVFRLVLKHALSAQLEKKSPLQIPVHLSSSRVQETNKTRVLEFFQKDSWWTGFRLKS